MTFAAALLASLLLQNDKTRANSYDDAWEGAWKSRLQTVLSGGTKTTGFVLHVGDSITHSNPYSQWPRNGAGKTAEDTAILTWIGATTPFPGNNTDANSTNGLYLAVADTSGGRGMTAASGISTAEFLSGSGNNTTPNMPAVTGEGAAKTAVVAASDNNLHIVTVAEAFQKAQFAVLMLGTNDVNAGRSSTAFIADLGLIVDALEARKIGVVVSTIPPHHSNDATVQTYNSAIRSFAQNRSLPLIDFYAEILARRSGTSWNGTLLNLNDVHPSATGGGFDSTSDPYAAGGNAATHTTGTSCDNVGYLLRSWLTVQKLKEVKAYVIDDVAVPGGGGGGGGGGAPPPVVGSNSGEGNDDDQKCSCGAAAPGVSWAWLGVLALAALRRRR